MRPAAAPSPPASSTTRSSRTPDPAFSCRARAPPRACRGMRSSATPLGFNASARRHAVQPHHQLRARQHDQRHGDGGLAAVSARPVLAGACAFARGAAGAALRRSRLPRCALTPPRSAARSSRRSAATPIPARFRRPAAGFTAALARHRSRRRNRRPRFRRLRRGDDRQVGIDHCPGRHLRRHVRVRRATASPSSASASTSRCRDSRSTARAACTASASSRARDSTSPDCQINGMDGNGVRVEGVGTVVVTRTSIVGSAQEGIFVNAAANVSIVRSRIQSSGSTGIEMGGGAPGASRAPSSPTTDSSASRRCRRPPARRTSPSTMRRSPTTTRGSRRLCRGQRRVGVRAQSISRTASSRGTSTASSRFRRQAGTPRSARVDNDIAENAAKRHHDRREQRHDDAAGLGQWRLPQPGGRTAAIVGIALHARTAASCRPPIP